MSDDEKITQFLRLLDGAIVLAEKLRQELDREGGSAKALSAEQAVRNLRTLRATAEAGKLPRPSRGETAPGTGLALSRFIAEWTSDKELLARVDDVESYYRTHF